MASKKKLLQAAAGSAGGPGLDVDEVFANRLWEGTGASRTITNDIDLSGEGGLVWIKKSSGSDNHGLYDTERGVTKNLRTNGTSFEGTETNGLTAFGSSGFTIGGDGLVNENSSAYLGWTFRKAPKFFDIVTWSGNGNAHRNISHNLGCVPGHIFVKKRSGGTEKGWINWHRTFSDYQSVFIDTQEAVYNGGSTNGVFGQASAMTSSQFQLGGSGNIDYHNASGSTYVAYLFAHNNNDGGFGENGDADIIKCGEYSGTGFTDGPEVNLGFEPQWCLFKNINNASADWMVLDTQRGWGMGDQDIFIEPNRGLADITSQNWVDRTPTGFKITNSNGQINASGNKIIYIAIRKGSLNVPTSSLKVFGVDTDATGGSSLENFRPHLCDMAWFTKRDGYSRNVQVADRLRGFQRTNTNTDNGYVTPTIITNANDSEFTASNAIHQTITFQPNFPVVRGVSNGANFCLASWKQAPSYFDIVAYEGNGTAGRNITHNLGATPEMIWVKRLDSASQWAVYHSGIGSSKYLHVDNADAANSGTFVWNGTDPTSSVFTVGDNAINNGSGADYIAYLFATADGVSKLGTVSHTFGGGNTDVDCGFTSGCEFLIIKSTTHGYSWEMYDAARGINSGTDPYIRLDTTDAEVTNNDGIDPINSGFRLTSTGWNTGTYIFYAIASA